MQISTKGRYGLRALVDIAIHSPAGPLALRVIAARQGISESYLEQVFAQLRRAGLVRSSRGAQGGYELSRAAAEITVGQVLRALEGSFTPVHCVNPNAAPASACRRAPYCATRPFWEELRDRINGFLDQTSLQDLIDRAPAGAADEPMYYI